MLSSPESPRLAPEPAPSQLPAQMSRCNKIEQKASCSSEAKGNLSLYKFPFALQRRLGFSNPTNTVSKSRSHGCRSRCRSREVDAPPGSEHGAASGCNHTAPESKGIGGGWVARLCCWEALREELLDLAKQTQAERRGRRGIASALGRPRSATSRSPGCRSWHGLKSFGCKHRSLRPCDTNIPS